MIADYHIHTRLCGHAQGEPREYVERAIELGLAELGFADHMPMPAGWQPGYGISGHDFAMPREDLDVYVSLVGELRREYAGDLRILLGIEADYAEETLDETAALIAAYPFEYVIGSVHLIGDGFAFDHPELLERVPEYGIDRVFLESLELVRRAAASGLFTVIGHMDQAKKSGHRPADEAAVAAAASAALSAIKGSGAALELNTAGWRKPAGEAYPSPALLAEARRLGIPITFGSDAHSAEHVAHRFAEAAQVARAAGYDEVLRLSGGACAIT